MEIFMMDSIGWPYDSFDCLSFLEFIMKRKECWQTYSLLKEASSTLQLPETQETGKALGRHIMYILGCWTVGLS